MERIFLRQDLPDGRMEFAGKIIDCNAVVISPCSLEGEKDDMIAPGVTRCRMLAENFRKSCASTTCSGRGALRIFNGSIYSRTIAPR
jgi:poly-beta-hydroxyalkanoate depolymerase